MQTMRLHAIPVDASRFERVAHDYDDEVQNVLKASQVRFATIPLPSQHEAESSAICNWVSKTKPSQTIHLFKLFQPKHIVAKGAKGDHFHKDLQEKNDLRIQNMVPS